jgi:hypothetical protein
MKKKEKLDKISIEFRSLNDEQQDYILGIMEALVFAKEEMQPVDPTHCMKQVSYDEK